MNPDAQPSITVHEASGPTRAVALVLHGGRADSFAPTEPGQLTAVRMRPFARSLHRRGRTAGLAVWLLHYRYRGWNGPQMSPVPDARWSLDEVRRRHGDVPVVLVGHSMGGRTALRVADDPAVLGVAALAPWLSDSEPVAQLAGKHVLIAHGDLDRVTSPTASRRYADRAAAAAASVDYVTVHGDMHAMLFRYRTWHRLATTFAVDLLTDEAKHGRVQSAVARRGGNGKKPEVRRT